MSEFLMQKHCITNIREVASFLSCEDSKYTPINKELLTKDCGKTLAAIRFACKYGVLNRKLIDRSARLQYTKFVKNLKSINDV